MSNLRTAQELAEQREGQELYARQNAIQLAHERDVPPEEVVRRATAYYQFIVGGAGA